jgi:hypothetical protein
MTAVPNSRENWKPFIHWLRESFKVKIALPRDTLSIPIFDNERLPHSAVRATDASFRFVHFDAPNMPATVTYSFVLFHRISVSVPPESLRFGNKGHRSEAVVRGRRLGAGRLSCFRGSWLTCCAVLRSFFSL